MTNDTNDVAGQTRRDVFEQLLDTYVSIWEQPGVTSTRTMRAEWVARFEEAEPTGVDLIDYLDRAGQHRGLKDCPGCGDPLDTVGITQLAYAFDRCTCGAPEYVHLVEQLWHRACLHTRPAAADAIALELLEAAHHSLGLRGPGSANARDITANRINAYLRRRAAQ